MVVLWRESEDTKRASVIAFRVFRVRITKQTLDGKVTTLDPDGLR